MTERSAHRSQNTVAYDSVKIDVETAKTSIRTNCCSCIIIISNRLYVVSLLSLVRYAGHRVSIQYLRNAHVCD